MGGAANSDHVEALDALIDGVADIAAPGIVLGGDPSGLRYVLTRGWQSYR